MGAPVVEYRTTRHPMAWPVTGFVVYALIFVLPGVATRNALVLLLGLGLCAGVAIWSLGFWIVSLSVDDTALTWRTPMRTGRVPLGDIQRVGPSPGNTRVKIVYPILRLELRGTNAVIDIANHRSLSIAVFSGFLPLLDVLRARCPNAEVVSAPRWERLRR